MGRILFAVLLLVSTVSADSLLLCGKVRVRNEVASSAVDLAVQDLLTDLERVLGQPAALVVPDASAHLVMGRVSTSDVVDGLLPQASTRQCGCYTVRWCFAQAACGRTV